MPDIMMFDPEAGEGGDRPWPNREPVTPPAVERPLLEPGVGPTVGAGATSRDATAPALQPSELGVAAPGQGPLPTLEPGPPPAG